MRALPQIGRRLSQGLLYLLDDPRRDFSLQTGGGNELLSLRAREEPLLVIDSAP